MNAYKRYSLITILIFVIILLCSSCGNDIVIQTDVAATGKAAPETTKASVTDIILRQETKSKSGSSNKGAPLNTSYDEITISTEQESEYPNLKKALADRNNEQYNLTVGAYNDMLQYEPYMFNANAAYEETSTAKIIRTDSNIVSIVDSEYSFSGGTHPNYSFYTYNFDPKTGSKLFLTDIITDVNVFLSKADELAIIDSASHELFSLPSENINSAGVGYTRFTVDKNGIKLYFPPYALASYASGSYVLEVPFSEINGIVNTKYLEHT